MNYDFSGWATKANIRCSDGRTIMPDAFRDNDGQTVPLVWNHQHNDANQVLGHALLENRPDGVYAYCTFNDTESGQTAKLLVEHGDVDSLSIYANQLKENKSFVHHGNIREVSLVLAGANVGAHIDNIIQHGEMSDTEAVIFTGEYLELFHGDAEDEDTEQGGKDMAEEKGKTVEDVFNELTEEQKNLVYALVQTALDEKSEEVSHSAMSHADKDEEDEPEDPKLETIKKKKLVDDEEPEDDEELDEDVDDEEEEEEEDSKTMKHNAFDTYETVEENGVLSHSEMTAIISDAPRYGSMSESVLAHSDEYGIDSIDYLFPDAKNYTTQPEFVQREMDWVQTVMNGVHHSPFSRVKTMFADITEDAARAKGYIKGNLKKEEVFSLLKRSTTPTTIYKKQKLDRDDIIDITDFDVIAWLKSEMRMMLDEEIARAILIGDGRLASDDDHIDPTHIRPIALDNDFFTIRWDYNGSATSPAKEFITAVIKSRKNYKGSGNPIMFTTEEMLTDCLLLEDTIGHKLYKTEAELATAMRVSKIVTVPVLEGFKDPDDKPVAAIVVNLNDYNVGADKGGSINMFEDFDIDFNQQKYLIETRCSGALVKPFSAIAIRKGTSTVTAEPGLAEAKQHIEEGFPERS